MVPSSKVSHKKMENENSLTPTDPINGTNSFDNVAVIFGVTGLVGKELARKLISKPKWKVYGISRRPETKPIKHPSYTFLSCDLLNNLQTMHTICSIKCVTHIFWVTWSSRYPLDSSICCDQNRTMMCNALDAILKSSAKSLKHVSLQTGMKHYMSLEGTFGQEFVVYDENCSRPSCKAQNFYHVLEDLLKEKLVVGCNYKIPWSVHRPGLILGCSQRTLYNFMGSLCVYGAICKHLDLPFVFGGSRECWEEVFIDGSDARLVAEQHIWSATSGLCSIDDGQAFNALNGSSFRWKEIWEAIGVKLGVKVSGTNKGMFSEDFWYSKTMADKGMVWGEIVANEGLVKTEMEDLAFWGFLDSLFRCPVKLLGSRSKVDRLGFTMRYHTLDSILYWIDVMRDESLIPCY